MRRHIPDWRTAVYEKYGNGKKLTAKNIRIQ
jgi:hypothetical protein